MTQARKIAPRKVESLAEVKEYLDQQSNFVLATYTGLDVEALTALRGEIRKGDARLKVVKNNLFRRALSESEDHKGALEALNPHLKGPVAVIFANENFPAISKVLVEHSKKMEQVKIKGGCLDGRFLSKDEVIQIAQLPTKDELLAIIARGLNTPAQKIAYGINEVMASLARAIKAVGEKNG